MKKMVLNATTVMKGCDVSYWQENVNFKKMYAAGIRFVIIRAGFGTSIDKKFITYINAALAAGLKVGIYWFMYANSDQSSLNNAIKCMDVIAPYRDKIQCGVWADWEYDSDANAGKITTAKRNSMVRVFLKKMQEAGYEVGIYSNQDYIQSGKFEASLIKEYPLWFAKYAATMGQYAGKGQGGYPYIWQHSSSGIGATYGVSSKYLDLNRGYFNVQEVDTETVLDKVQKDNTVIKASDNPYPEPERYIRYLPGRYMQYGDDVKWVQWHLWRFGLLLDESGRPDASKIDGYYGLESQTAVIEAQKRLGFAPMDIDGVVGPYTIKKFISV